MKIREIREKVYSLRNGETVVEDKVVERILVNVTEEDVELLKTDPDKFWGTNDESRIITAIGDHAFCEPTDKTSSGYIGIGDLKMIEIPNFVTKIGEGAFLNCEQLVRVDMPGVKEIGNCAFRKCKSLEEVWAPRGEFSVGDFAFDSDERLQNFDFSNVTSIGEYAFQESGIRNFVPTSALKRLGKYAFAGCSNLKNVYIPRNLHAIEGWAFVHCRDLRSVVFSEDSTLSVIGGGAFANCEGLKAVCVQRGNKTLESEFENEDASGILELPMSIVSVGYYAFSKCKELKSLRIPLGSNLLEREINAFPEIDAEHITFTRPPEKSRTK